MPDTPTTRLGLPGPVGGDPADVPGWIDQLRTQLDLVATGYDGGPIASRPTADVAHAGWFYLDDRGGVSYCDGSAWSSIVLSTDTRLPSQNETDALAQANAPSGTNRVVTFNDDMAPSSDVLQAGVLGVNDWAVSGDTTFSDGASTMTVGVSGTSATGVAWVPGAGGSGPVRTVRSAATPLIVALVRPGADKAAAYSIELEAQDSGAVPIVTIAKGADVARAARSTAVLPTLLRDRLRLATFTLVNTSGATAVDGGTVLDARSFARDTGWRMFGEPVSGIFSATMAAGRRYALSAEKGQVAIDGSSASIRHAIDFGPILTDYPQPAGRTRQWEMAVLVTSGISIPAISFKAGIMTVDGLSLATGVISSWGTTEDASTFIAGGAPNAWRVRIPFTPGAPTAPQFWHLPYVFSTLALTPTGLTLVQASAQIYYRDI